MDEVEKWETVYVIWYKLTQVAILKFDFQFVLTNPVSGFPLTRPTWIIKLVWGMLYAKVCQEITSFLLEDAVHGYEIGAVVVSFPLGGKYGKRAWELHKNGARALIDHR